MESKIKIKIGPIEIEYEGSEAFLKEELPALIAAVSDLHNKSAASDYVELQESGDEDAGANPPSSKVNGLSLTTGSIAARLGASSGPELVLAAAARLTFFLGEETFTRAQITAEMKSAAAYYKQTYTKNLSGSLNRLVKEGKMFETSKGKYSVSASTRSSMESRLAQ